jgi:hypothetical protein
VRVPLARDRDVALPTRAILLSTVRSDGSLRGALRRSASDVPAGKQCIIRLFLAVSTNREYQFQRKTLKLQRYLFFSRDCFASLQSIQNSRVRLVYDVDAHASLIIAKLTQ